MGVSVEVVPPYFSVKEAVFPFTKFPEADPILGPEMKIDGRGHGHRPHLRRGLREGADRVGRHAADARAWRSSACAIATSRAPSSSARSWLRAASRSSRPTARRRRSPTAGVPCRRVNKVREGRPHIVDMIKNDEIALIVNTTEGKQAIRESHSIRREAVHTRSLTTRRWPPRSRPARRSTTSTTST